MEGTELYEVFWTRKKGMREERGDDDGVWRKIRSVLWEETFGPGVLTYLFYRITSGGMEGAAAPGPGVPWGNDDTMTTE